MIVLLEGGEGAGKTTLAKHLESEHNFKFVKFPTPGSYLESVIFNKESPVAEKAVAATLDFCQVLREEMKTGKRLVLDRGPISTVAYQGPYEFAEAIKAAAAEWTVSVITHVFICDVDVETGLSREKGHNEVSEAGMEFHRRVNQRMRYMYNMVQAPRERITGDMPPFYPTKEEPQSLQFWEKAANLPWTRNFYKIDTNESDEEQAYMAVLEKLGLVGAAG